MEQLKTLFTEDKVINIADTNIKIKEVETQHLPLVFTVVEKGMGAYAKATSNVELITSLTGVIAKDFKLVLMLIENLTDLPKDKIPKLNIAASTLILKNIIEVNLDFLHLNLKPVLEQFNDLREKYRGLEKSKDS